ncbi:MAG: glycosyltransferase [Actinobacteria bacterium]|nr:MAG: glycosyltransferase [Actinomycetota bacterium]
MDSGLSVERRSTPHLIPGRRGESPSGIVVHTTVGSFDSTSAWFAEAGSGVSAHYLVGLDGRVVQFVDEHDAARHVRSNRPSSRLFRRGDANCSSVGIEFEDAGAPDAAPRTAEQYAAGAALMREIAERWSIPLDREHVVGHREVDASQTCPGNLDIDRLVEEARVSAAATPQGHQGMNRLVCLLPVRNEEDDLPGYLDSVARFADAVVALDDGSTDRTASILRQSELVDEVLTNPPRPDYTTWDDGANRNRLLAAAGESGADWLMWLDADERIDVDDAAALRELIERDAVPGLAYGFRVHRMVGDEEHYDGAGLWVYRLFAHRPGQRLADRRLHGVPIPDEIPRSRWIRTTIRIKHLAGLDERRREARFAKYAEADPEREHQEAGYDHVLEPPRSVVRWRPRPPGQPLLEPAPRGWAAPVPAAVIEADLEEGPALSAIVIAHDDEDRIEASVGSVVAQECPEPFEVVVVASGSDGTAAVVRERFPQVSVIELPGRALPGAARNAGLRLARGEFISFPGSHVVLPPGSLAARLRAHRQGHAMVTGTLLNATRSASGWASYFLDHSAGLPARPSGPLGGPPDHCSYMRHHLLQVGGFPEQMRAGEDTLVNRELARLGYGAYRAADVRLYHRSPCTNAARLVAHHFTRGRALARIVLDDGAPVVRNVLLEYVPRRLSRTNTNVRRWGGALVPVYRRVLPLVVLGALSAWAGCWYEVLARRRGARARPSRGDPGVPALSAR